MSTTLAKPGTVERKWYIIDAAGKLAGKIAHATPPDQVVVALRQYLKQP